MKKIITIACIVLIIVAVFVSPLIIKVKVDCKSQYGGCPQPILDKLNSLNGKSLLSARSGVRKILKSEVMVSDFSIQYKIPDILRVELLVKKAVVAFKGNGSGSLILVDKDGKVLSQAQNSVLPVITLGGDLPGVGQSVSPASLFAVDLAEGVYQMYQVQEFSIQDGSLLVELPGQIRVIFPLEGDSQALLGSLRLIYSKLREDANLAGYSQIDLRYKNPVLR